MHIYKNKLAYCMAGVYIYEVLTGQRFEARMLDGYKFLPADCPAGV